MGQEESFEYNFNFNPLRQDPTSRSAEHGNLFAPSRMPSNLHSPDRPGPDGSPDRGRIEGLGKKGAYADWRKGEVECRGNAPTYKERDIIDVAGMAKGPTTDFGGWGPCYVPNASYNILFSQRRKSRRSFMPQCDDPDSRSRPYDPG